MRLGTPNNTGTPVYDELCNVAAGYIRRTGCVSIVVMHKGEPHMLILKPEDLEELATKCRAIRDSMPEEHAA